MTTSQTTAMTPMAEAPYYRWMQLVMGIVCMAMIANLQYGWTLFVDPIDAKFHWGRAAIQLAFTLFVVTETWLVPVEAWFVDKYGPRVVIKFGAVMITIAWVLNSYADSLVLLYIGAIIGGIGAGSVYGTCVGNALKWFPDHRGLAAGSTAAGFGAGAALTVVPIANMIASDGYQHAFFTFGIGQGVVVFILAFFLRKPSVSMPPKKKQLNLPQTKIDFTPPQVLRSPIFWVMYLVFVMVASGGLMAAAQIAPIAHDYKIAGEPVSLFGFQMAALTFAISLDRIFDGIGRPFFGWYRTISAASTPCSSPSRRARHAADAVDVRPQPGGVRAGDGSVSSACSAKSTACSRQPRATRSASNTPPPTTACCTPPRAPRRCWCRSPASSRKDYGWQAVFVIAVALNAPRRCWRLFVIKPMRRAFILGHEATAEATARNAKPA